MNKNWTGKIAQYFIENGKLTSILMLGLFMWGVFAFILMPKKYNPTIVAPAFQIVVDYPGANRKEVLEQVTKPLERVLSDIAGVEDIFSTTLSGGRSIINVSFFVGEELDSSKVALNDRINTDSLLAPLGITNIQISSIDPEDVPIITIALGSNEVSDVELRKFGFKLRERLSQIDGVTRLNVIGGRKRELGIGVDLDKLSSYGLSLENIEEIIRGNNLYLNSGLIKMKDHYIPIESFAWVQSPEEIKNVIISTNDSLEIKLGQVTSIKEQVEEVEEFVRHVTKSNFKETNVDQNVVFISLAKKKGGNITELAHSVEQEFKKLQKNFIPQNISSKIIVNEGVVAKTEIDNLLMNLATSVAIVMLVLFVFLNVKAAFLVAFSIPLTLFTVFGIAHLAGQDINRITLFALILSLGLLVDNATVVIENIIRRLSNIKNLSIEDFSMAVNEVGPGLFMSTVTTILAFLPMKYISGMMGPYMGPIPFYIPAALLVSLLISFSINPWMASVFFKKTEDDKSSTVNSTLSVKLMLKYRRLLHSILESKFKRNTILISILLLLILVCTFPIFQLVKFRMLPKANVNQFYLYVDLPSGTSLEKTNEVTQSIERKLLAYNEIEMVQSYVGRAPITDFNGLFKGVDQRRGFQQATIRVGLVDKSIREIGSEEFVTKLREQISSEYISRGVKLKFIEDPPGPPVLSTVLLRFQSNDLELAVKEAREFSTFLKNVEGVVDLDISEPEPSRSITLKVDHAKASRSKISPAQIASSISTLYAGRVIGVYHHKDNIEQEFIRLTLDRNYRIDQTSLEKIKLTNSLRISVPLSTFISIQDEVAPTHINRENHQTTVYLTAEMSKRSVTYASIDILKILYNHKLSKETFKLDKLDLFGARFLNNDGETLNITLGGEWELTLEVFRDLMIAMLVAIVAIYLVLVAQFKSFLGPVLILSAIPLSLLGVMPGFLILNFIKGEFFTATSMIGVIALAGIAVNNSIILLEYLNDLKDKDRSINEALIEACVTRLRPIALTTVTTVLGSVTIINDPVWAGLAWAIILGLAVSSALLMIVFPALYQLMFAKR